MWKAHVGASVKKGLRDLWSCNAFIGRAWGLMQKMALWFYKRVIILKIIYATVAWWDIMDIALVMSEWENLQRATCTMITGVMRTTPTTVFLDLPTLRTAVEYAALMAAYRLPRPDPRNLGIEHNRIWAKTDKMDSKFCMIKDHVTLRRTYSKYRIVGEKLVQSTQERACLVHRWSL